eukprot:TRINITY_DN10149_c0_g1_i1.p1 TRINITY_DN10149_c0_g1~~TRINITY_DN10149_c0_g1_i1.p1  ORF type:complete len:552 (+),score=251.42 TRINITY_DN10149_c0_g1_i1:17-1672(+)
MISSFRSLKPSCRILSQSLLAKRAAPNTTNTSSNIPRSVYPNAFVAPTTQTRSISNIETIPRSEKYDVCVIGCGSAGFAAAMRAWDYKKKVIIIEKTRVGGATIHNGALSSKTYFELSTDYNSCFRQGRGFEVREVRFDYEDVRKVVASAQGTRQAQMEKQLFSLGVPLVKGSPRFIDPHHVIVERVDGDNITIEADNFVIATGSSPRQHESIPMDGDIIVSSDHIMNWKELPKSIVILGAGVVGCEYAGMFSNFGIENVSLIDKASRILPFEDEDISMLVSNSFKSRGVNVHHGAKLVSMEIVDGMVQYTIDTHGKIEVFNVEKALLSIGRVPNLEGLGLEELGISTKRGVEVNDCRTVVPNIYACGDTTVDVALVNVAETEGRRCIHRMYSEYITPELSYTNISSIMFVDPVVSAVGANEQMLQAQKIPYKVAIFKYDMAGRAIAVGKTRGGIKLLVANDPEMRILGIRAWGLHSSSIIEVVSLMIRLGRPVKELSELRTAYPSVAEGLQECVRLLLGNAIFKPNVWEDSMRLAEVSYDNSGKPIIKSI